MKIINKLFPILVLCYGCSTTKQTVDVVTIPDHITTNNITNKVNINISKEQTPSIIEGNMWQLTLQDDVSDWKIVNKQYPYNIILYNRNKELSIVVTQQPQSQDFYEDTDRLLNLFYEYKIRTAKLIVLKEDKKILFGVNTINISFAVEVENFYTYGWMTLLLKNNNYFIYSCYGLLETMKYNEEYCKQIFNSVFIKD